MWVGGVLGGDGSVDDKHIGVPFPNVRSFSCVTSSMPLWL